MNVEKLADKSNPEKNSPPALYACDHLRVRYEFSNIRKAPGKTLSFKLIPYNIACARTDGIHPNIDPLIGSHATS
jgi:hypothetical protein